MASNFYSVLEVSEAASQATIDAIYEKKLQAVQGELDNGNPNAKGQLWVLKQAYETLSSPAKRVAYDQSLRAPPERRPTTPITQQREGLSWKATVLLVALLGSGLVGFGLQLGKSGKKDDVSVQVLTINRTADNDATRATTERILVDGTVSNQAKTIDAQTQVANRVVSVQESAESRASRELEYRANAGTEILRQQQERLKMENQQLQWERQQATQVIALQQSQERAASDRLSTIQAMIANDKIFEARTFARTDQERALVASAERTQPHSTVIRNQKR